MTSLIQEKMQKFCQENSFINIEIPGDGNCFFHCIHLYFILSSISFVAFHNIFIEISASTPSIFRYKNSIYSYKIRNEIFEFIHNNEAMQDFICLYGGYEDNLENLVKEVDDLQQDTNYEIPLFDLFPVVIATLYQVNVCIFPVEVHEGGDDCKFTDCQTYKGLNPQEKDPTINLLYINSCHYELLYNSTFLQNTR
jgi:hypothetical protein